MNFKSEEKDYSQRLITLIVPIHNMAGRLTNLFLWLPEADQLNFQVVLVCNRCDDNTKSQLEEFIIKRHLMNTSIVECEEIGPGHARNFGKLFTQGEFTLFWDSDDIGYPQKVIEIIQDADGADALVANYATNTDENGTLSKTINMNSTNDINSFQNNPGLWRIIFKSETIKKVNFGDSRMGEEQVFVARFLATNPTLKFNPTCIYRYFTGIPNQLTSAKVNMDGISVSLSEIKKTMCLAPTPYLTSLATFFLRMCLTGIKRGKILLKVKISLQLLKFIVSRKSIKLSFRQKLLIFRKLVMGIPNEN